MTLIKRWFRRMTGDEEDELRTPIIRRPPQPCL